LSKKISRRDFSRTSVAAGAAAVALPAALLGAESHQHPTLTTTAAKGAEAARRRRAAMPSPMYGYGGDVVSEARDSIALSYAQNPGQGQSGEMIAGWRPGTTLPVEYYIKEAQYLKDEKFLIDNVWLMVDHESRIPKPGDYFVWEFGRGESVIVLRDKAGAVRGFHNVCRHRASRIARHHRDPAPQDAARLSVKQLGPTGNTPVFRCPYHAWTYDLDGRLISAPNGMPSDFDSSQNGLIPCHIRTSGGFIIANLSLDETPPDFDSVVNPPRTPNWVSVCEDYGTAKMKIAVRQYYAVKANWKLVMENFHECYHCGPAHKSLVTAHPFWDGTMTAEQRTRIAKQVEPFVPTKYRQPEQGGMGSNQGSIFGVPAGAMLNVGFSTGSLDGKPVAPLVPTKTAYTHTRWSASTTWALGNIQCYDDYVAVVRHTPRDVMLTDVEIFWLVNADAIEGRDYKPERVMALWDVTEREDRWIVENQMGLLSSAYKPGRYAVSEGASRFIQSYMREVVQGVKSL
jgi:phenylpropionate dioxygenase-like ring-hydroxylating dioxygenase large terminal subunit